MKAIYLASALLLSAFIVTPASAAPAMPATGLAAGAPSLIRVQYSGPSYDNHARREMRRHERRRHYVPGHRYHTAPRGWHRYHRRPHDWRIRGCILVGPFWFCP